MLSGIRQSLYFQWLAALFGLTLLLGILAVLTDPVYRTAWLYFISSFSLVSNLYMLIITRSVLNKNTRDASAILGALALKQLFTLIFILIYLVSLYKDDQNEIWICLGLFFAYSFISYYYSFKVSK